MKDNKQIFSIAGAYIAFMAGSGVATGQEILQYYTPYGFYLFAVGAVCGVVLIAANACYAYAGHVGEGVDVFQFYCGKTAGRLFRIFSTVFCFLSYVVMISAAAAACEQQWGIPSVIGGVLMCCLTAYTVVSGFHSIVQVISKIGPLILVLIFVIAVSGLVGHTQEIPWNIMEMQKGAVIVKKAADNWLLAGLSSGGFCLLWLVEFTSSLGREYSIRTVIGANILATVAMISINSLIGFSLLANLPEAVGLQIPNLYLAEQLWQPLSYGFVLLVLVAVYNSSTPLLWTVSMRLSLKNSFSYKLLVCFISAIALLVALSTSFDKLMNMVYVINGYAGAALLLVMAVRFLQMRWNSNRQQ